MLRIIDTFSGIHTLYDQGKFNPERWAHYINSVYAESAPLFWRDLDDYFHNGDMSFEKDFLPLIEAVPTHPGLQELHESFLCVTNGLQEKIQTCFGNSLDADIVLYLGLCNAAGWVTTMQGRTTILLGIEKILELNWQDKDAMIGLIYHELGHVYHKQHGSMMHSADNSPQQFVWQLFQEGVAMHFEQLLVGDSSYYHQNKDRWLDWCEAHAAQITADFRDDLPAMTRRNQRWFGDWVSYCGKGDVGYYLGARFVQWLRRKYSFDELIRLSVECVYRAFLKFTEL